MKSIAIAAVLLAAAGSTAATQYEKGPDLGPFWNPIGQPSSDIYVNRFVMPNFGADNVPGTLGTWLSGNASATLRFEIWADNNGTPNQNAVLATTGSVGGFNSGGGLAQFDFPVVGNAQPLTAGQTYWFALTTVGEGGSGTYQVGGHTQNSVYPDNGTFGFSNDDGQNWSLGFTPEMAYRIGFIPAPGAAALLGLGGLAAARRRR